MEVRMEYSEVLKKLNFNHRVKIRLKLRNKRRQVVFEINSNYTRNYIYQKLYMSGESYSDKQVLRVSGVMRDKLELEMMNEESGLVLFKTEKKKPLDKPTFYDYAMKLIQYKKPRTKGYYVSGINSFANYIGMSRTLDSITEKNMRDWSDSLNMTDVTRHNYLRVVNYVQNNAVKDGLIKNNPGNVITIRYPESERQFINEKEIQKIANVSFDKPAVKDAFLFSCYTGLRLADIFALKWSNIKDGHLYHVQSKTGHSERMKLSQTALEILNRQIKLEERVFIIPSRKHFFVAIRQLIKKADLDKRITFHCARHTFATLLISSGADLLAVKELMGHRDIRTTLIYAKLVSKVKDEAIDKLPVIPIKPKK
jgi:integrase